MPGRGGFRSVGAYFGPARRRGRTGRRGFGAPATSHRPRAQNPHAGRKMRQISARAETAETLDSITCHPGRHHVPHELFPGVPLRPHQSLMSIRTPDRPGCRRSLALRGRAGEAPPARRQPNAWLRRPQPKAPSSGLSESGASAPYCDPAPTVTWTRPLALCAGPGVTKFRAGLVVVLWRSCGPQL